MVKKIFGFPQKYVSGISEFQTAFRARKKLDAEIFFNGPHMRAGRRLADVKTICRAGEMLLLGNGDKGPHLYQVHHLVGLIAPGHGLMFEATPRPDHKNRIGNPEIAHGPNHGRSLHLVNANHRPVG